MVGQSEQPTEKTTEEITREAVEEMARAAQLEQVAAEKRHNGRQDDLGSLEDDVGYGTPSRGHHPKYNQRRPSGLDRL
jgi:hypothetical protein